MLLALPDNLPAKTYKRPSRSKSAPYRVHDLAPKFPTDAECVAWIVAESRRRLASRPHLSAIKVLIALGAEAFGFTVEDIVSPCRIAALAEARQKITCIAYAMTKSSYLKLSFALSRDHSTIIYSCNKWHRLIEPLLGDACVRHFDPHKKRTVGLKRVVKP